MKNTTNIRWGWIVFIAVCLAVTALGVLSKMTQKTPVRTAIAKETPIQSYVEERARTSLPHIYHITMPMQGRVLPIRVEEGDPVNIGDIVVRLDDIDWQDTSRQVRDILIAVENWVQAVESQVKASKIRQDFTKWEWQKNEKLLKSSAVSERKERDSKRWYLDSTVKIEESQAMRHMSKAMQSIAEMMPDYVKRNLERTLVKSPVAGTILKRHVWNEKVMTPGEPLLDIGNLDELEVTADILTENAIRIQAGDNAVIFGEAVGDQSLSATVRLVEPEAFTKVSSLGVEEQRVAVKISFAEGTLETLKKTGRTMGLQYRVRVRIITDEKDLTTVVPRTSLFHGADGRWQLYKVEGGRARLTDVKVGLMNDYDAEILAGVAVGDAVIIAPESSITEGTKVSTMK